MTTVELSRKRKRYVKAWKTQRGRAQLILRNPHHDIEVRGISSIDYSSHQRRIVDDLKDELAAWDQASDEDFERFEQSLE